MPMSCCHYSFWCFNKPKEEEEKIRKLEKSNHFKRKEKESNNLLIKDCLLKNEIIAEMKEYFKILNSINSSI